MTKKDQAYWNEFYGSRSSPVPAVPSQFAVFTVGEIPSDCSIVDVGCGTGRDSLFFASIGRRVLGVDGSSSAVELCQKTAKERGLDSATFICHDVASPDLGASINGEIDGKFAVYARFFIHAIDDEAEAAFLSTVSTLPGLEAFAVEFRTDRDAQQEKVTASHYRRFVRPFDFIARAQNVGLVTTYFSEGFGFAKFKQDDAHVARIIMRPASA